MSEIPNLIDALRLARDMADKEPAADMLHFLIAQALDEAIAEAQRRDLPVPPEAKSAEH